MTAFVGDILSATAASVSADPAPTRTWAWLRNGTAISGQTAATYRVTDADVGAAIWARQIETNFIGSTAASSNPLSISSWSPSSLFAANEPGIWLDPSNLTTMFQDRFGVTPVTAPGQFVGLRLDESRGLVLGSEQVLRGDNEASLMGTTWQNPVLATNGTVVRSTEQASTGSASAKFTSNTASSVPHYVNFGLVPAGLSVRITGRAYLPTGSLASLVVADISDGSIIQPIVTSVKDAWVSFTITRVAKATAWPLAIGNNANEALLGAAFYLDNVSVRELLGNHAAVTDDLNRGIYGIEPVGGRRNLLTFTEQFDNAAWNKGNGATVIANTGVAPDGTLTADSIVSGVGTSSGQAGQTLTLSAVQHTFSAHVRAGTASTVLIGVFAGGFLSATGSILSGPGSISGTGLLAITGLSSTAWTRVQYTFTGTGAASAVLFYPETSGTGTGQSIQAWGAQLETGSTATAYQRVVDQYNVTEAGVPTLHYVQYDGSNDGYVTPTISPESALVPTGPELVVNGDFAVDANWTKGTGWTIGSGAATTASGGSGTLDQTVTVVAGRPYRIDYTITGWSSGQAQLGFSGGTTVLGPLSGTGNGTRSIIVVAATGNNTLRVFKNTSLDVFSIDNISVREMSGAADKVQVFAGVRKLSDAATGMIVESSTDAGANNGAFRLLVPGSAGYEYRQRGTINAAGAGASSGYASPITNVLTGIGDIAVDNTTIRINGAQISTSTADQGTGNFLAYPLYIGRRGGTTLPYTGRDYGIIVRFGANLSTSNINRAEYYMAQKTGVTL